MRRVPVRMGIAYGTFHRVRFRADTTEDVGIYTSQFYGTGAMRAYKTEHNAGKGMRVFIHPSAEPHVVRQDTHPFPVKFLELPEPSEHARFEMDYLFRSGEKYYDHFEAKAEPKDLALWEAVTKMRAEAPRTPAIQVQYDQTLEALNRMRAVQGRPLYPLPAHRIDCDAGSGAE